MLPIPTGVEASVEFFLGPTADPRSVAAVQKNIEDAGTALDHLEHALPGALADLEAFRQRAAASGTAVAHQKRGWNICPFDRQSLVFVCKDLSRRHTALASKDRYSEAESTI